MREYKSLILMRVAETVNKYSRKAAIVQTGLKTQVVSLTCPGLLPRDIIPAKVALTRYR